MCDAAAMAESKIGQIRTSFLYLNLKNALADTIQKMLILDKRHTKTNIWQLRRGAKINYTKGRACSVPLSQRRNR